MNLREARVHLLCLQNLFFSMDPKIAQRNLALFLPSAA